jgi:flagellar protein FliO/FliZ
MSMYLSAILMLAATLAAFVLLAKLAQSMRTRGLGAPWRGGLLKPAAPTRLVVEQACMVDGKRRLVLVRCDEQRVLLLTGGAADLVVSVLPPAAPALGQIA